jgi:dipeptidyl aminopeptidase/acylaminoacyl peptidase
MRRIFFILLIASYTGQAQPQRVSAQDRPTAPASAQEHLVPPPPAPEPLTVEKIMQDPEWIGTSPSDPYWSANGKMLFFHWNPTKAPSDSLYYITPEDLLPRIAPYSLRQSNPSSAEVRYNKLRTVYTYEREGDIFLADVNSGLEKRITNTVDTESSPVFSFHNSRIVYARAGNLFAWEIAGGITKQLTDFQPAPTPPPTPPLNAQEKWLRDDQLQYFEVLRDRKNRRIIADSTNKANEPKRPKTIYLDDRKLNNAGISPDGRFITYCLYTPPKGVTTTIVPSYVTETGFTRDIPSRTKVGAPLGIYNFFIFDTQNDTILHLATDQLPGIIDPPDYIKESVGYKLENAILDDGKPHIPPKRVPRDIFFNGPYWSEGGSHAVLDIRSQDRKDRWLILLDPASGKLTLLDRQRDEAWIAGPGIGDGEDENVGNTGWIDENTFWYQSETSGYSHLYKVNVTTGEKTQLTHGAYEVLDAALSKGKKYFYITTNENDPGQQQYYRLSISGGPAEPITTMKGANLVTLSPNDQQLAILNSYSNRPWELYLQGNNPPGRRSPGTRSPDPLIPGAGQNLPRQITFKAMSPAFRAYPWRDPEIITFKARDGATLRARIYRQTRNIAPTPAAAGSTRTSSPHPGVIFVHGAGYLQNAHKWWSYYFHEFMFNNLLADNGYTVLDIDYRGSAGYGRDWRTAIYRHMGGKDLSDQIDGARWLTEHEAVDPKRIGIYGGSYGGFITLMAMFTEPNTFVAGAALRSVTDWAHYNHGYTSSILNEPYTDSLAYRRSSPIYFAEGLKGHLLMCHGMVDENVHFQDIVRLTQRLIELGKDNWELAVYPLEDHSFIEASSWTDEYKRVYKLFNTWLNTPDLSLH